MLCLGIDIVAGLLLIPCGPFVSAFGTAVSNGIRIYANHTKLKNHNKRTKSLEKLISNYNSMRDSQKLQVFLKHYSDSLRYPSDEQRLQKLQRGIIGLSVAVISFSAIRDGLLPLGNAIHPLGHVASVVTNVVGVSLCVGSVVIQGVLAVSEAKIGNNIIEELENIIQALQNGKNEMKRTMLEMDKMMTS